MLSFRNIGRSVSILKWKQGHSNGCYGASVHMCDILLYVPICTQKMASLMIFISVLSHFIVKWSHWLCIMFLKYCTLSCRLMSFWGGGDQIISTISAGSTFFFFIIFIRVMSSWPNRWRYRPMNCIHLTDAVFSVLASGLHKITTPTYALQNLFCNKEINVIAF
jgi:hypothetical protein